MSKKRIIAMIMAGIMSVTALTACGNGGTESKADSKAESKTESKAESKEEGPKVDTSTVDEYIFMTTQTGLNWDNPVAQVLQEKTGVKIVPQQIIGVPEETVGLMLGGGDYPDMMSNVNEVVTKMYLDAECIIDLTDLIEEYGPDIKAFYGDTYKYLRYSKDDQSIYGFGTGASFNADQEPGYNWNASFFLSGEALEYSNYPDVKTPEDFTKVIKDFITANPKMADGETDRIGLNLVTSDGWRFQNSILQPIIAMNGYKYNGEYLYDEENNEIDSIFTSDALKDGLKWYNEMWNDGLIDPESFTDSYDIYLSKYASGRIVGAVDSYFEFWQGYEQGKTAHPELAYMPFGILTDPENMDYMVNQPIKLAGSGGTSISVNAEKPEKIVNLFNYMATEEGQILTECGIEGENYTIVDGERVWNAADRIAHNGDSAAYIEATGCRMFRGVNGWPHQPLGFKTADGQPLYFVDEASAKGVYSEAEIALLDAYNYDFFTDVLKQPSEFELYANGCGSGIVDANSTEERVVAKAAIQGARLASWVAMIQAKDDAEFEAGWEAWMKILDDNDYAGLLEGYNADFQNKQELYA